jgi:hypothetical protein
MHGARSKLVKEQLSKLESERLSAIIGERGLVEAWDKSAAGA